MGFHPDMTVSTLLGNITTLGALPASVGDGVPQCRAGDGIELLRVWSASAHALSPDIPAIPRYINGAPGTCRAFGVG